jgi:hypothetical protein
MRIVVIAFGLLRQWAEALGPYLLLELALPGGSLWALLYFLYRRRREPRGNGAIDPLLPEGHKVAPLSLIGCRGER